MFGIIYANRSIPFHSIMSITIGVATSSSLAANAAIKTNISTFEMLQNLQKLVDEFKTKLTEMDEEMNTVKLEISLLKNKINELTSIKATPPPPPTSRSSGRGFFGYGPDEF
jgi:prophage DNA circulation protein